MINLSSDQLAALKLGSPLTVETYNSYFGQNIEPSPRGVTYQLIDRAKTPLYVQRIYLENFAFENGYSAYFDPFSHDIIPLVGEDASGLANSSFANDSAPFAERSDSVPPEALKTSFTATSPQPQKGNSFDFYQAFKIARSANPKAAEMAAKAKKKYVRTGSISPPNSRGTSPKHSPTMPRSTRAFTSSASETPNIRPLPTPPLTFSKGHFSSAIKAHSQAFSATRVKLVRRKPPVQEELLGEPLRIRDLPVAEQTLIHSYHTWIAKKQRMVFLAAQLKKSHFVDPVNGVIHAVSKDVVDYINKKADEDELVDDDDGDTAAEEALTMFDSSMTSALTLDPLAGAAGGFAAHSANKGFTLDHDSESSFDEEDSTDSSDFSGSDLDDSSLSASTITA